MAIWNPWHGCRKISPGCLNCYVYRRDAEFGKDSSIIARISSFDLPVKRNRKGLYKLQPDERSVYTCMTSDFLVEEADEWRPEAWKMIWERGDLHKEALRIVKLMPKWIPGRQSYKEVRVKYIIPITFRL